MRPYPKLEALESGSKAKMDGGCRLVMIAATGSSVYSTAINGSTTMAPNLVLSSMF
jgi:hypothetical protein